MKKIITLAIALLGSCMAAFASYYEDPWDFSYGGIYYYISGQEVRVTYEVEYVIEHRYTDDHYYYSYYQGDITIPEIVSNDGTSYTVTSIGSYAFVGCAVTSVTLPSTLKTIYGSSFSESDITSIDIPDAVTSIGYGAFSSCTKLERVELGGGNTSIDSYAFSNCNAINTIVCRGTTPPAISSSSFPSSVMSNAVVYVPKGCMSAYASNANWAKFNLQEAGEESDLLSPSRADDIITLNEAGATITLSTTGNYQWDWDAAKNRLTSTNKGKHNTTSQTTISFTTTEDSFFSLDYGVSSESNDKLYITLDGVTYVDGLGGLMSKAQHRVLYSGRHNLVVKYIKNASSSSNDDAAYISNMRFEACGEIANSGSTAQIEWFKTADNALYVFGSGQIPDYFRSLANTYSSRYDASITRLYVDDGITAIGNEAFRMNYRLESVRLPEGLESLGTRCFHLASYLREVHLPSTLKTVGEECFWACVSLRKVNIPKSVTSWGREAFFLCENLSDIDIEEGVTSLGEHMFSSCANMTSITLPSTLTSIGDYAFYSCHRLFEIRNLSQLSIEKGSNEHGFIGQNADVILTRMTDPTVIDSVDGFVFGIVDGVPNLLLRQEDDVWFSIPTEGDVFYHYFSGTQFKLPDSYRGQPYRINSHAFDYGKNSYHDCDYISELVIPEACIGIDADAFGRFKSLRAIQSYVKEPYPVSYLPGDSETCTLYVPYGTLEAYRATEGWNKFTNIIEREKPLDVEDILEIILNDSSNEDDILKADINHDGKVSVVDIVEFLQKN